MHPRDAHFRYWDIRKDSLVPGATVVNRAHGEGQVLSLSGGFFTVQFGATTYEFSVADLVGDYFTSIVPAAEKAAAFAQAVSAASKRAEADRTAQPAEPAPPQQAHQSTPKAVGSPVDEPRVGILKPFWKEVWEEFQRCRVSALYHVTDKRNVESIKRHGGLYSWALCQEMGIQIPFPGGSDLSRSLDRNRGLERFVRLCFNWDQPAVYSWRQDGRVGDMVYFAIDPAVALLSSTFFSNENATANTAIVGPDLQSFRAINLDVATAKRWTGSEEKRLFQAEVLVFEHIPLDRFRSS